MIASVTIYDAPGGQYSCPEGKLFKVVIDQDNHFEGLSQIANVGAKQMHQVL